MNLLTADITQAIESKMDRSKWQKWKISDLVENINEKVAPKESGLEHYIGLEHLDSGSLHIRRFGETASLTGDKLKIYKGDLIFAKRNAYLKRVAIAEFDAVASAHSLVLRAKPENVLPEFLPFFMLSETFWERAIEISVGSLSPTINWRVLAKQEFLLPPKEQQAEIAELLWIMDDVVEEQQRILSELSALKQSYHKELFSDYKTSSFRIGAFAEKVGSGVTPKGGSKVYQDVGVRFIRSQNVLVGNFDFSDIAFISDEIDANMASTRVFPADVLLNITGASIGRSAVYTESVPANVNQHVCIIRTKNGELDPFFLCEFINSRYGQNQIQLLQAGGNREGLNFGNIKLMKFPEFDYQKQQAVLEKFHSINNAIKVNLEKIVSSRSLQKSLINQVF